MQPDAIPINPVRSYAELTSAQISTLFGEDYLLRGSERVEMVQRGKGMFIVDVRLNEISALFLDFADHATLNSRDSVTLCGPKGEVVAPSIHPIPTLLVLPAGLLTAWNLSEGQKTTVSMGSAAIRVVVAQGGAACVCVDRAIPFAGGLDINSTARWLPNVEWPDSNDATTELNEQPKATRRLITENDVRRARRLRQKIRIDTGQIITPAARSLGEELDVFEDG